MPSKKADKKPTKRKLERALLTSVPNLIAHKRDGGELVEAELRSLIDRYTAGEVPDYQMSAFAMAVYFQSMTPAETRALTLAMRDSGRVVKLSGHKGRHVDKHSTGGVGDKISICLAPLVAACGVRVPMISGRGLGHTGGTLDKLEAIEGFDVTMSVEDFVDQVQRVGCALIGQTEDLAPADKRLYALRDVTATVESIPLITASILSKKLAEGIDGLVLDVKVGKGAFMKTLEDARALADSLVRVGRLAGKKVTAVLSAMESPLGAAVGNALETKEALHILHGEGPDDVRELTMVLGSEMLLLASVADDVDEARQKLEQAITSGSGVVKMKEIVREQGGDTRVVDEPDRLPTAAHKVRVTSERDGYVTEIDALRVGLLTAELGGGRSTVDDTIDPAVGVMLHKKPGDRVKKGEVLAELHMSRRSKVDKRKAAARNAFTLRSRKPDATPLVHDILR